MRYRELKVGMLITGKPNNGYAITSQYSICRVLKIQGLKNDICVEVIDSKDHPNRVGTTWDVNYERFVKYGGKEINCKFKVGDYVVGNIKNNYSVAGTGVICLVTRCYGDGIYVKVVNMTNGIAYGTEFPVETEYFDHCDYKLFSGLFSKAYYSKKFTVDNEVVCVSGVAKNSPCYIQLVKECMDNGLIKKGE